MLIRGCQNEGVILAAALERPGSAALGRDAAIGDDRAAGRLNHRDPLQACSTPMA